MCGAAEEGEAVEQSVSPQGLDWSENPASHMSEEQVQTSVTWLQNLAQWEEENHKLCHVGSALSKTALYIFDEC